mgnify:CR=1 FL=1
MIKTQNMFPFTSFHNDEIFIIIIIIIIMIIRENQTQQTWVFTIGIMNYR